MTLTQLSWTEQLNLCSPGKVHILDKHQVSNQATSIWKYIIVQLQSTGPGQLSSMFYLFFWHTCGQSRSHEASEYVPVVVAQCSDTHI